MEWNKFSVASLPPTDFVLVYVEFDGPDNPRAKPRILLAYYSYHDGYWRTAYGRLQGRVTHWMLLPPTPAEQPTDEQRRCTVCGTTVHHVDGEGNIVKNPMAEPIYVCVVCKGEIVYTTPDDCPHPYYMPFAIGAKHGRFSRDSDNRPFPTVERNRE